MQKQS